MPQNPKPPTMMVAPSGNIGDRRIEAIEYLIHNRTFIPVPKQRRRL
jgi:hypothetical protein